MTSIYVSQVEKGSCQWVDLKVQSTEDEGRQDGVGGVKWEAHFKNSGSF